MSDFSLDSQPYAVLDDPRRLQVVSLPGRQALLQRMTVDIGAGGVTPPNRLRVLVRAEQEQMPVSALRVRVTDIDGVDLVAPYEIDPDVLRRPRQYQWLEVPLVATVGFGTGSDVEVLVWFSVSERGPGWEVAAPSTGENVPAWRGPLDPLDPAVPVFGNLLTFPAAAFTLVRVDGTVLTPDIGGINAGEMVGGDPTFVSSASGLRNLSTAVGFGAHRDVAIDGSHVYTCGEFGGGFSSSAIINKYTRSPFAYVQSSLTAPSGTMITGRCITTHNGFGYVGSQNGRIAKINLSTMLAVGSPLVLGALDQQLQTLVNDGTHLYAAAKGGPGRVVKVRMSDMVQVGSVTLASGEIDSEGLALSPDGSTLYVSTNFAPFRVVRVTTSTMTRLDAITHPVTFDGLGSKVALSPDGTFGVVVTFANKALRFTTSPFAFTGGDSAVPLPSGFFPPIRGVVIDSDSYAIYGVSDTDPSLIYRWVSLPDGNLSRQNTFTATGADNGWGLTIDDRRVYVAPTETFGPFGATTAGTVVSEVSASTLANSPVLEVPHFDSPSTVTGFHADGTSLYVAGTRSVSEYNSTTGARLNRYLANCTSFVADATHIYITEATSPVAVRQLDKTDLSSVSTANLDVTYLVGNRVASQDSTHVYYGTTGSPAVVIKVTKAALATQTALTLNAGENALGAIVADTANDNLYACTTSIPAKIVKVDRSAMTRTAVITLASGEGPIASATIKDGSLFVLTSTLPAKVIEIDLATFTRLTAVTFGFSENIGQVLLGDEGPTRLWAGMLADPRVVRLGKTLASTGVAHALQINSAEDAAAGLDYARNFREDADVSLQFGNTPEAPESVALSVSESISSTGCISAVAVSWDLPDDECATVVEGGYVEVQRNSGTGWVSVYRVYGDVTRTVTDVEVARNANNSYRLRIVNDAGFVSGWTAAVTTNVESQCCGYVFASNRFPDRSVWYDDLDNRQYRFVQTVNYVEFEGRDGSEPLRLSADQLDEFDVTLMVAAFGATAPSVDTASLVDVGRTLFAPLTTLVGNKRALDGSLLRAPYISVADDKGRVWHAIVNTVQGEVVAAAGLHTIQATIKEVTRTPEPVELRPVVSVSSGAGAADLPLSDPDDLLGS